MNRFRFLAFTGLLTILMTSCTVVTTTNVPGKKGAKFPKNMLGKYLLEYPGSLAALTEGEGAQTYVTFKSKSMIITNSDGDTETQLGDSLFISSIGKQLYISLGAEPNISVFRIEKSGKNILLYSMCTENYITTADLNPFFSKVEEVAGEPDENGEAGASSFVVTIDDSKLDEYYKSGLPMKDPFTLKKQ